MDPWITMKLLDVTQVYPLQFSQPSVEPLRELVLLNAVVCVRYVMFLQLITLSRSPTNEKGGAYKKKDNSRARTAFQERTRRERDVCSNKSHNKHEHQNIANLLKKSNTSKHRTKTQVGEGQGAMTLCASSATPQQQGQCSQREAKR